MKEEGFGFHDMDEGKALNRMGVIQDEDDQDGDDKQARSQEDSQKQDEDEP